jgi:hypothetical protein
VVNPPPTSEAIALYFDEWLPERKDSAQYLITPLTGSEDLSGWAVVDQITYQDGFLRTQTVYTLERQP